MPYLQIRQQKRFNAHFGKGAAEVVAVEVNATAQLATLIRSETGCQMDGTILKYDGRASTPEHILAQMAEEV